jgi:hypothetical protein
MNRPVELALLVPATVMASEDEAETADPATAADEICKRQIEDFANFLYMEDRRINGH